MSKYSNENLEVDNVIKQYLFLFVSLLQTFVFWNQPKCLVPVDGHIFLVCSQEIYMSSVAVDTSGIDTCSLLGNFL